MSKSSKKLGLELDVWTLRRKDSKRSGKLILIVCEGSKTEPGYFRGLRNIWRLRASQVEVVGKECGTVPLSVVNKAIEIRDKEKAKKDSVPYDEVWCVFDKEKIVKPHPKYIEAVQKARDNNLLVATSVPCFEVWYLLHYAYTTRPFDSSKEVIDNLKKHVAGYKKSKCYLQELVPRLDKALANAEKLRTHNEKADTDRPSTDVDKLVRSMMEMRRK